MNEYKMRWWEKTMNSSFTLEIPGHGWNLLVL